jgi:HAD superfamily hydrolase (TIGR01509 family)
VRQKPKLETPKLETPKLETPKLETPKLETPKLETPKLEALILDFDGTLLDTEGTEFEAYQALYRQHGLELSLTDWQQGIGTWGAFDPWTPFEQFPQVQLEALKKAHHHHLLERLDQILPREGIPELLEEAKTKGIRLAIASSSDADWIGHWGHKHGLLEGIEVLATRYDVEQVKPHPALYLLALERLNLPASAAMALEDSLNGYRAAVGAGLFCLALTHPITESLEFPEGTIKWPQLEGGLAALEGLHRAFWERVRA